MSTSMFVLNKLAVKWVRLVINHLCVAIVQNGFAGSWRVLGCIASPSTRLLSHVVFKFVLVKYWYHPRGMLDIRWVGMMVVGPCRFLGGVVRCWLYQSCALSLCQYPY